MSGTSQPIYYWDSCVYLALILNEQSHGPAHVAAMTQIAAENFKLNNTILTSVITLIEVLESTLTPDQANQFNRTFNATNHVLYDVDPPIARKARLFRQQVRAETSKVLSTPDAIHLATAVVCGAHEVHTFDDGKKESKKKSIGMLELSGKSCVEGLIICKPTIPQGLLALQPPAQAIASQSPLPPLIRHLEPEED